MRTGVGVRREYKLKNIIKNYYHTYSTQILISALFVLLGIVMGIIIVSKYNTSVEIDNIFDKNLLAVIKGNRGFWGLFFSNILVFMVVFSIIVFLNFRPWLMVFTFLCLTIIGYIIGFNVAIVIILFGFIGFLNAIVIIIPINLAVATLFVVVAGIFIKRGLIIKKFGCLYWNHNCGYNTKRAGIILFFMGVTLIIIKCLLMPILSFTIIVN